MSARDGVDRAMVLVDRELRTVARTRTFLALSLGFAAVVVGLALAGGGVRAGYLPLATDLLGPLTLLVPVLAFAFGYRAVVGDAERGELAMLRSYPVPARWLVAGVALGRAGALLVAVLAPLLLAGLLVPALADPGSSVLASHGGVDGAVLYLRFVVLTAAFALVALAVAVAASAVAGTGRRALALAVALLVVLVVGLDLGLVAALAGGVGEDALPALLAASPTSAYRGLVLATVVDVAGTGGVRAAAPLANAAGLLAWLLAAYAVAVGSLPDG